MQWHCIQQCFYKSYYFDLNWAIHFCNRISYVKQDDGSFLLLLEEEA